jgi:hypothetical protein
MAHYDFTNELGNEIYIETYTAKTGNIEVSIEGPGSQTTLTLTKLEAEVLRNCLDETLRF